MDIYFGTQVTADKVTQEAHFEKVLGSERTLVISSALKKSDVRLGDFLRDAHSFVFILGDSFLLSWAREVCGMRMIVLGSSVDPAKLLQSDLFLIARQVAQTHGCQLMQWAVLREDFETRSLNIPSGFFTTNLVFEKTLTKEGSTESFVESLWQPTEFGSEVFQTNAADTEYWVRWTYPGSTFAPLDTIPALRAEYAYFPELEKGGAAAGICLRGHPSQAYVVWIQNRVTETALIAMIWIHSELRMKISGFEILSQATRCLKGRGFKTVRYFVSAQNISAMKMLSRAGFQMTRYVINAYV